MSRTLKIVLAYDGTRFVGWQRQPEGLSIQALLEDGLSRLEGRPVTATGAGRTDAGVHALGQVASVRLDHPIATADLARALNAMLPPDVRILEVEEAGAEFHARYSAREKTYRYFLACGAPPGPFESRYVWHVPYRLSAERMAEAARTVEGEHDFSAFRSAGSGSASSRRHVRSSRLAPVAFAEAFGWGLEPRHRPVGSQLLCYEVTGNGFLRHMVRAIVGSLVEVGAGRREPDWFEGLLRPADRAEAGPTAPAWGLFLVGVGY
jgi:tRNA pseudouridine38-40 synthase